MKWIFQFEIVFCTHESIHLFLCIVYNDIRIGTHQAARHDNDLNEKKNRFLFTRSNALKCKCISCQERLPFFKNTMLEWK